MADQKEHGGNRVSKFGWRSYSDQGNKSHGWSSLHLPLAPLLCYRQLFSMPQVTSPDGKFKYTYYENVEGEDEEDEDVSNDGSWDANLKAQCRCGENL